MLKCYIKICTTANSKYMLAGVSNITKVRTFMKIFNGLLSKWLGIPSLIILTNHCVQCVLMSCLEIY